MDTGVLNISDGAKIPTDDSRYVVVFADRDQTLAGTQAITGFGFRPKAVIAYGGQTSSLEFAWAMRSSSGSDFGFGMASRHSVIAGQVSTSIGQFLSMTESSSNQSIGSFQSFDDDGITINWIKNMTPTGTTRMGFLGFK